MHGSSYTQMSKFVNKYLNNIEIDNLKILDIGSQDVNGTYKKLFLDSKYEYTGVDMCPGKNVDLVLSNIYEWKEIESESIDAVICGQVFEHVEYIWNTILEITRVMKENGYCCIIAPATFQEHRYPVDCWRFYSDGFKALAKFAGLQVLEAFTEGKDTILIARKPTLKLEEKTKLIEKTDLLRKIAKDYEINI